MTDQPGPWEPHVQEHGPWLPEYMFVHSMVWNGEWFYATVRVPKGSELQQHLLDGTWKVELT